MANTVSASADPVPHQPQKEAEHMDRRPKAAQGFEAAYDAYGPMVYRLAMVYLGSKADAEDVSWSTSKRPGNCPSALPPPSPCTSPSSPTTSRS